MMGVSNDGTSSLSAISTPSSPENLSGRIVTARLGTRESIPCCRPDGAPPLTIIPAGEAPPPPHMAFLLPLRRSQRWWWGCGFGETKAREQRQGIFILRGALEEVAVAQCGVWSALFRFTALAFFLSARGSLATGRGGVADQELAMPAATFGIRSGDPNENRSSLTSGVDYPFIFLLL
jgi:hypothetical protein